MRFTSEGPVRILLTDDQELMRDTIAAFLRQEIYLEGEVARDFPSVVEAVRNNPGFDLVLLGYMMPGRDGLAGLAIMKKLQGSRPVAIISGTAPRSVAKQALAENHVDQVFCGSGTLHGCR